MAEAFPTWQQKVDAIKAACEWATGVRGDWKYKAEAFSLPENNDAWFELSMGRIRTLGIDDICSIDNGVPVGGGAGAEFPRSDLVVGQRQFFVELRTFNRDQEQDVVAWIIADRARAKLSLPYVREEFFTPAQIGIAELFEVVPMPSPQQVVQERWQSEAVLEMDLTTSIVESDGAAIGTFIESIEVSSNLINSGGDPLAAILQLDNEVMP